MAEPKIFGITGWKNSGKTTMTSALIQEFTRRGYRVASVKHAHHNFEVDHAGTDSHAHRESGASEVAIVSSRRWAIMNELGNAGEPDLAEILAKLSPCDIVLIEGYKKEPHPKLETIRAAFQKDKAIWQENKSIVAIATDIPVTDCQLRQFSLNAIAEIADMIVKRVELGKPNVWN